MKKNALILAIFLIANTSIAKDLILIKFNSHNYDTTLSLIKALESKGVIIRHIFVPNIAIADALELPDSYLSDNKEEYIIYHEQDLKDKPTPLDANPVTKAYLHLINTTKTKINIRDNPEYFKCIEYAELGKSQLDSSLQEEDESATRYVKLPVQDKTTGANRFNGQYMIGYIAAGIYLIESNGSQENWYPAAEQETFNEIVEGLDWLSEEGFQRGAKVVWVYPPVEKIYTSYEPINDKAVPYYHWQALNWVFNWLDDIYTSHGLTDEWDGAYALANKLRKDYKTNWAVEISVVMDDNDPDHEFDDNKFSYVRDFEYYDFPFLSPEFRSPIVVITYNNDSWFPSRMNYVVAHEVSHTFGTSDEYTKEENPPSTCKDGNSCSHQRAFLRWIEAENDNCVACNNDPEECYMRGQQTYNMCSFTPAELGWRDLDGDGAMDPIDQNTNAYMWIQPVAAGDLIRIFTIGIEFMNLVSVTEDMLCGSNNNAIFWDG